MATIIARSPKPDGRDSTLPQHRLPGTAIVRGYDSGGPQELRAKVEELSAENVKRVHRAPDADPFSAEAQSPFEVTALMEFKTVWHPMGA